MNVDLKIGQTLQALRAQWKAGNFSASKDELLQSMNEEGPFGIIGSKSWTYYKQRTIHESPKAFCTIYCKESIKKLVVS